MQKEKLKGNRGITLIALIITIIVMLILVGTSIQIVVNSDLINTGKSAKEQTEAKYEEEKTFGDSITINGKDYSNLNDYMGIIKLVGESDGNGLKDYKIYGNSIQNGIPTPNAPIEIESVGERTKNLLNPNTVENTNNYINSALGNTYPPSSTGGNWRASDFIPIIEGKIYHFNAINSNASAAGIAWYDINKTYISGLSTTTINGNNGNMTAPSGARYIRVSWRIDEGYNPNWQNTVQLEEGTEETEYELYGYKIPVKVTNGAGESTTTNIYLDEPLRKIGDVSDYIDFETGKVVRNIGKHIYNENDNWQIQSSSYWFESGATSAFYTQIPNNALGNTQGLECLCNLFKYDGTGDGIDKKVPYISGNIGSLVVNFYNTTVSTIEELETYLAQINLEIIYKLATPDDTETINLPDIPTYEGKTIIEIGTEIQPSDITVEF